MIAIISRFRKVLQRRMEECAVRNQPNHGVHYKVMRPKHKNFQSAQTKRDVGLLLQGGGVIGLFGDAIVLLMNFSKGQAVHGWPELIWNLIFCLASIGLGSAIGRNASKQLNQ